jgi:ribulose kinase
VAFGTRNVIESIEEAGVPINRIFTFGGVTKNDFWIQMIADVAGYDLTLVENFSYVSLIGCAVIAAYGSGTYDSFNQAAENMIRVSGTVRCRPEEKLKYEKAFAKYKSLYLALKPLSE